MDRFDNSEPTNDWHIPESIVVEILSRVPARDLVRNKTVCKQWRSLIDDPYFIDLHKSRARRSIIGTAKYPNSIPPDGGEEIFLSSKRHSRVMGSSTHGLVCARTRKNNYHIRNPATGKTFQLPPLLSNSYVWEMSLYFIPQSQQFKVVAMCECCLAPYRPLYWALFTIGIDSEWRYMEYYIQDIGAVTRWTVHLCESGPICLIQYGRARTKLMKTLRLDPYTEQVTIHTTPFYLDAKRRRLLQPHQWDGKFSISCIGEKEISTWILEDHETNAWRNERVIIPRKEEIGFRPLYEVCFVEHGKMWLRSESKTGPVFTLDLVTKQVERIACNATRIYGFEPCQRTLETLEGKMK